MILLFLVLILFQYYMFIKCLQFFLILEMVDQLYQNRCVKDRVICSDLILLLFGLFFVLIGVVMVIIGVVKLYVVNEKCSKVKLFGFIILKKCVFVVLLQFCCFFDEVVCVGLLVLLDEVKIVYFVYNFSNVVWNFDLIGREMIEYVKIR